MGDADALIAHTEPAPMKGWRMLNIHAHTATKFAAILDRADSENGEKGAREIDRLLNAGASAAPTIAVLMDASGGDRSLLPDHIERVFELLPVLAGVDKHRRRRLGALRREWVDEAEHRLRECGAGD